MQGLVDFDEVVLTIVLKDRSKESLNIREKASPKSP